MGRFDEFELKLSKINDYPLTFEAEIPETCNFFQDVRRYQSLGRNLEIRVIKVDGRIQLDPDMEPVTISKLTAQEKKDLIEYLKVRVGRGDNIGYAWAFFRSSEKKTPVIGFGANIVHRDTAVGQDRSRHFLSLLQRSKTAGGLARRWLARAFVAAVLCAVGFSAYQYRHLAGGLFSKSAISPAQSPAMNFYQAIFPDVYTWFDHEKEENRKVAQTLLNPAYITDLLSAMGSDFHSQKGEADQNRGNRLILFVYFNYNHDVAAAVSAHHTMLKDTEFMRLARIYSTRLSGYASNIFYFKVGDLDIKHAQISQFMKHNLVTYKDFKKIRDKDAFSELMEKDSIDYKMKGFLEDVYTFTPLRIQPPENGMEWYLLTQSDKGDSLDFAAFFRQGSATLIPKRIGNLLLGKTDPSQTITWYPITPEQASELKLSDKALTYFTSTTGHGAKLNIIQDKIKSLGLAPEKENMAVAIHRELLMGDTTGKYGLQTYDPVTSLVLSNLITKSSFEKSSKVLLKRDPIQVNTSLVQLSKDDSFSVQSVTITPGTTGIVRLFDPRDHFKGKFANGQSVRFEKASTNLFNPFTFMISKDSITFSYRHDITDMEILMGNTRLKVVKAEDGNFQIIEIF